MAWNETVAYFKEVLLPLSDKFMTAVVLVLIGLILGRIGARFTARILKEINCNDTMRRIIGRKVPVEELAALAVRYFVYIVFAILALNQLGLTVFMVQIIAVAILLAVLISVLLSIKDFIPNFLAGMRLQSDELLKEGDKIEVGDLKGRVQKINITDTFLRTKSGDLISVPNAFLLKQPLKREKRK